MDALKNARVLVETLELSVSREDHELILRVEIFESLSKPNHYCAPVWRLEHYRIQSTFPQLAGAPSHPPSDEVILRKFEGIELPAMPRYFANAIAARTTIVADLTSSIADGRLVRSQR